METKKLFKPVKSVEDPLHSDKSTKHFFNQISNDSTKQ